MVNNDKNEPVADATPVGEQIGSLEQDEIDKVDLTLITGGTAPIGIATSGGKCGPP